MGILDDAKDKLKKGLLHSPKSPSSNNKTLKPEHIVCEDSESSSNFLCEMLIKDNEDTYIAKFTLNKPIIKKTRVTNGNKSKVDIKW